VVGVHDFAHLLMIALRQRVTAKRDTAPAFEAAVTACSTS
jgi:hypothetical protein